MCRPDNYRLTSITIMNGPPVPPRTKKAPPPPPPRSNGPPPSSSSQFESSISSTPNTSSPNVDEVQRLNDMEGNNRCVDCNAARPDWASLAYGIVICLRCSGHHRSLGTHITQVRSLSMDTWTRDQLDRMKSGGNAEISRFFRENGVPRGLPIEAKYQDPKVLFYRDVVTAKLEGRDLPVYQEENKEQEGSGGIKQQIQSQQYNSSKPAPLPDNPTQWVADEDAATCQVCYKAFNFFRRRHHCRKCGRCVCGQCAPKNNSRPIPEWDYTDPVRHCRMCYKSPILDWT